MAMLPGMFGTGNWAADQRPKNFREMILRLFPDSPAIFTAFLGKLPDESTDDPEFAWFEQGLPELRLVAAAAFTNSATTITIQGQDSYKNVRPGLALLNERTLEVMWVTNSAPIDATTSQVTVVRGKGSTAAAGNAGDGLLILGSHHPEGDGVPKALHLNPVKYYNYCQIFRDSLHLTRTAEKVNLRTGPDYQKKKRDLSEQHAIRMEQSFLFGTGVEEVNASNGMPERTTKGFIRFVATNIFDWNSGVSSTVIDDACEQIFRTGSSTKLVLAGSTFLNTVNKALKKESTYMINQGESVYGVKLTEYVTPFGTLMMKMHPLLSQNPTFRSWGLVIDTKNVRYRYLRGRDTQYLKDRQNPGDDVILDELLTEAGLEVNLEQTHAIIKNALTVAP